MVFVETYKGCYIFETDSGYVTCDDYWCNANYIGKTLEDIKEQITRRKENINNGCSENKM